MTSRDPDGAGSVGADESREEQAEHVSIQRLRGLSTATTLLLVLAVFYTLSLGRVFFLPLILALLLSFLLRPPVRVLARWKIPESVGAAVVLLACLMILGAAGYYLSGPAIHWTQEAPDRIREAEYLLRDIRRPMEEMRDATNEVEDLAELDGNRAGEESVQVQGPRLSDLILGHAVSLGIGTLTVIFLLYFLLATGDMFLRKLVRVLPRLEDQKRAVEIARRIESEISNHLLTVTTINLGLGAAVWLAFAAVGMPNPALWGGLAAVLNFVPYLGAIIGTGVLFLAALTTFDSVGGAFGVAALFVFLSSFEAYLVTPLIQGRRLTLNPVVIFVGVIFWGWLWGIAGAVLAVPILATTKIFCDNIERLETLGEFLGR